MATMSFGLGHAELFVCLFVPKPEATVARGEFQQDKLGAQSHMRPPVYNPMFFDISNVVFVCIKSSLLCAHAATDSCPRACFNGTYLFPVCAQSVSDC